ncbi:AEC family transporter [Roseospirillum parvum]|uniref:Permease n=1 Tax=Roseospirillum parvum TaxID=83401 RepID=A0A1G8AWG8_9PROT|nr:AEC family transporter [Roseospirillum parvum]SDH25143.1 hypothetical protein SAMN05421742_105127 [Roseospirillum parvum]
MPAIDIVLPVFAVMVVGWLFARGGVIDQGGVKAISDFVFLLAVPALLFRTTAQGIGDGNVDPGLFQAYYLAAAINFFLALFIGWKLLPVSGAERAVMTVAATFSNAVLIGIPLVERAFGPDGLVPLLLLVSVHAMILLTAGTIAVEIARGAGNRLHTVVLSTLKGVAKNPLIMSLLAGFLWHATGVPLPAMVDSFCSIVATGAGPAALFAVGAGLAAYRLSGDLRHIVTLVGVKCLLMPLWVWLLATRVFDVRPDWVPVMVVMAALPIGANASLFALRYGLYIQRATGAVFLSTLFSVLTLTVLIGIFRS